MSHAGARWSTASFAESVDTSADENSVLGEHLHLCQTLRGRMFALRCRAEALHGFVATHLVTTVVAACALGGALLLTF